ncbi:MAG: hypothetical protein Q9167_001374 [Letrouitia subvulpina]
MPALSKRSRYHDQNHYFSGGVWIHPYEQRQSCYSDFVPCSYDDDTSAISRLYKYVRTFLVQKNGSLLSQRLSCSATVGETVDLEMISTSPSPTLHASKTSFQPYAHNGSRASSRLTSSNSPRLYVKPPPPAAFPRHTPQSPASIPNPSRPPPVTITQQPVQQPVKATVDAGTQYSPPPSPSAPAFEPRQATGRKRGTPDTPEVPTEPKLEPQMSSKRSGSSTCQLKSGSASSATLVKDSSVPSDSSEGSSPKRARAAKASTKYLPAQYETCDPKDLVVIISNMLMELIRLNDEIPLKDGGLTRFHSRAPPTISVRDYLQRLTTHATLSPPILLSMVYYIDRLCILYPAFTISSLTVHRFLITSATVASKGLSDLFWTNNTYARVGGITLKELALLELEFLWRVEWRIVPKPEDLVDYYRSLVERSDGYRIKEPGKESDGPGIESCTDVQSRDMAKS